MNDAETIVRTFDRVMRQGFSPKTSPMKDKVVILVSTAQGIIDNGGFEYFFEQEFEDGTELRDFVHVSKEIGAIESSVAINEAITMSKKNQEPQFDHYDDVLFDCSATNYSRLANFIRTEYTKD